MENLGQVRMRLKETGYRFASLNANPSAYVLAHKNSSVDVEILVNVNENNLASTLAFFFLSKSGDFQSRRMDL